MHRGLLLGGLLMASSITYAMDYSHPLAPKDTTDCVDYATTVLDGVENAMENETDRNKDVSEIMQEKRAALVEKLRSIKPDISNEDIDIQFSYMKLMVEDIMSWYRSSKYSFDPQYAYQSLLADCEIGVMEAELDRARQR